MSVSFLMNPYQYQASLGPPTTSLSVVGTTGADSDLSFPFQISAFNETQALVSSSPNSHLKVIDFSTPSAPTVGSTVSDGVYMSQPRGFVYDTASDLLYVTDYVYDIIVKYDASSFPTISRLANTGTSLTEQVSWVRLTDDGYVIGYCNGGDYRVTTHLASTMADVDHRQYIGANRGLEKINESFVASTRGSNFEVTDISDRGDIFYVGGYSAATDIYGFAVDGANNRAYLRLSTSLDIIDISDYGSIASVGTVSLNSASSTGTNSGVVKYEDTLAVTTNDGVQLVDISNEASPTVAATLGSLPASGVALDLAGNYLLLTVGSGSGDGYVYVLGA